MKIDLKEKIVQQEKVAVSHSSTAALEGGERRLTAGVLVNVVLELVKIRITFFVGMSALFGYILAAGNLSWEMLPPVLGIFLLSCASAAMNHYQEKETDSLMHRTMKRPLPTGVMSPASVLLLVGGLAFAGSALIFFTGNLTALILSWLAFISYNVVYTPLKKVTPFAVIPGSFVGAFPVMAGWAAAGADILNPRLAAVAIFFFIWQIPHFWLLMEMYSTDYERAGFPTLRMKFGERVVGAWIFIWTAGLALSSLLFVTSGVVNNVLTVVAVMILGIWLALSTYPVIYRIHERRTLKSAFMKINIYALAVTAIIMIDKII